MIYLYLLLSLLMSCATKPTSYQKEKKSEGYSDSQRDELRIVTFKANRFTRPSKARLFAEFRAIENCQSEKLKHANILDVTDKSVLKEVTRTDSDAFGPSYYGGMYPFYSRYSSFGVGVNFSNISSRSWNETYTYPQIEIPYTCANAIYRPEIIFKEISADKMKHLVKDIKGAVQIDKFLENSPNKNVLKVGDIILKVNNQRIEKVFQIIQHFGTETTSLHIELLRDGLRKRLTMKAIDVSEASAKAEEKIIKEACRDKKILEKHKNDLCLSSIK